MTDASLDFKFPVWVLVAEAKLWTHGLLSALMFSGESAEGPKCLIVFDKEIHAEKFASERGQANFRPFPMYGVPLLSGLLMTMLDYLSDQVQHFARYNPATAGPYTIVPIGEVMKALASGRYDTL
jgi:hypothetical protein